MRGPRLSPHPLLCFPWDPSHRGNFADCQHRQYTVRCPTIIIFTLHREHQRKGEWLSSLSNLLLEDDVVDFNQHIRDWCLKCALTLRSQLLSFKSRDRHWSPSYADLRINSMPLWYSVLVILWILDQAFISVQIRYENQSSKINYTPNKSSDLFKDVNICHSDYNLQKLDLFFWMDFYKISYSTLATWASLSLQVWN